MNVLIACTNAMTATDEKAIAVGALIVCAVVMSVFLCNIFFPDALDIFVFVLLVLDIIYMVCLAVFL